MSEIETKKESRHKAELAKVLRQQANKITAKKTYVEINESIKIIKRAIKAYQAEESRLFWEAFQEHYKKRKWRPFF